MIKLIIYLHLSKFKFKTEVNYLDNKKKLYAVIQKMKEVNLHINKISNNEMGYIYEEILRRFTENSAAGRVQQENIIKLLGSFDEDKVYLNREAFIKELKKKAKGSGIDLAAALKYLFKTSIYILQFKKYSSGVGAGLTRLHTSDLFNIESIVPPLEEQAEIVDTINEKLDEINATIRKTQQQIPKLKEARQSLISEAVTEKIEVL